MRKLESHPEMHYSLNIYGAVYIDKNCISIKLYFRHCKANVAGAESPNLVYFAKYLSITPIFIK